MFAYPHQAYLATVVSKSRIYTHGKVSRRVQALFVAQVSEVVWRYKLSPETINLPERNGIVEIQVFELHLRQAEVDDSVLEAIDRAVPHPLLFELVYGEERAFAASYKRPHEAKAGQWVIEERFRLPPLPQLSLQRRQLPVALDLASLHEQLVQQHIPLAARRGETLAQQVARFSSLKAAKARYAKLQTRINNERQFNRKVVLHAQMRDLSAVILALESSEGSIA